MIGKDEQDRTVTDDELKEALFVVLYWMKQNKWNKAGLTCQTFNKTTLNLNVELVSIKDADNEE